MTTTAFVRQLGAESGVQLNPLRDNSEIPTFGREDQTFAIAMRATRGRIDKAFLVDRSNVKRRLGHGEPVRTNALNEAWVHVVEALNSGAYEAVVSRLTDGDAELKWIVVSRKMSTGDTPVPTGGFTFTVSATEPTTDFLFAVKHLDCFNDGLKVSFRADEKRVDGANVANDEITIKLIDPHDDAVLFSATGSLTGDAKDDSGNAYDLPAVVERMVDNVEVVINDGSTIATDSEAYGYLGSGQEQWAESAKLNYFTEGTTSYATADYARAREQLTATTLRYGYIAAGGSEAVDLIGEMAQLAFDTARQLRLDIPGDLTADEAIAFVEQLNLGGQPGSHLLHSYWAPLKTADPTGINGKRYFGTSTLNIAMACSRNARVNARGFAPKNYPVAGRAWPLSRQRIEQTYTPTPQELNRLAKAKINPVIFETYSGGGLYVFRDSLTSAAVDSSLKKLIAVAEMSSSIDHFVTKYGKDLLQLPMEVAIKRMRDALTVLFEAAQASGWLVPSSDPEMDGAAWRFEVQANAQRPYELMDVRYWLRYDGTTRQIHVTQTLSK